MFREDVDNLVKLIENIFVEVGKDFSRVDREVAMIILRKVSDIMVLLGSMEINRKK